MIVATGAAVKALGATPVAAAILAISWPPLATSFKPAAACCASLGVPSATTVAVAESPVVCGCATVRSTLSFCVRAAGSIVGGATVWPRASWRVAVKAKATASARDLRWDAPPSPPPPLLPLPSLRLRRWVLCSLQPASGGSPQ